MNAIDATMIGATWQRCRVHFMRNVLAKVGKGNTDMVAAAIRTIVAQPTNVLVREQVETIAVILEATLPTVAAMLRQPREEITACADFPALHWRKIWSANPSKQSNREVKRRTDLVGDFLQLDGTHLLHPGHGKVTGNVRTKLGAVLVQADSCPRCGRPVKWAGRGRRPL